MLSVVVIVVVSVGEVLHGFYFLKKVYDHIFFQTSRLLGTRTTRSIRGTHHSEPNWSFYLFLFGYSKHEEPVFFCWLIKSKRLFPFLVPMFTNPMALLRCAFYNPNIELFISFAFYQLPHININNGLETMKRVRKNYRLRNESLSNIQTARAVTSFEIDALNCLYVRVLDFIALKSKTWSIKYQIRNFYLSLVNFMIARNWFDDVCATHCFGPWILNRKSAYWLDGISTSNQFFD